MALAWLSKWFEFVTYEKFLSFFSKEKDKMVGLVGLNGEEGFLQVLFFYAKVSILILWT